MKQEAGKRVVSKEKYFQVQGKRLCILLLSVCLLSIAGGFCIATLLMGSRLLQGIMHSLSDPEGTGHPSFSLLWSEDGETPLIIIMFYTIVSASLGLLTYYFTRSAIHGIVRAKSIDPGVPLTRANTGDLPASDSLVRASEEPLQAQQNILLRAATETLESQEEELLRASVGGRNEQ